MITDLGVYDAVIPHELLRATHKHIESLGWHYGWKSSTNKSFHGHWHIDLTPTGRSKNNRLDIRHELHPLVLAVWDRLSEHIFEGTHYPVRTYANAATFGTDGYSHTDSHNPKDRTVVVYLNEKWLTDWAGETVVYDTDEEIIIAVKPKFARVLVFPSSHLHAARAPSRTCPAMRAVLVFKLALRSEMPE